MILHLAHTILWAGHHKIYLRLISVMFKPIVSHVQSVKNNCATCKANRAPLQPMPVITTPFRQIPMDIVGPLKISSAGNQYIVVMCHYATQFPEGLPLR